MPTRASARVHVAALCLFAAAGCATTTQAPSGLDGGADDMNACVGGQCGCATSTDCMSPKQCDPVGKVCVDCLADKDCPAGLVCSTTRACVQGCTFEHPCGDAGACEIDAGICVGCVADRDCSGTVRPRCDPAARKCVTCLPPGMGNPLAGDGGAQGIEDNCGPSTYCAQQGIDYYCIAGCKNDTDCLLGDGGALDPDGGVRPGVPHRCAPITHDCVQCLGDDDCPLGKICKSQACVDGCSMAHGCASGLACCNGTCSDAKSDANNCGACGMSCQGGWSCCNGTCSNPTSDQMNCGACGTVCSIAHGTPTCSNRACAVASCDPGWADCLNGASDGCETHVDVTVTNCGACNNACSLPHALPRCAGGTCLVDTCIQPWGDCNGNAGDGCESNLDSDAMNCGACGSACPTGFDCIKGACSCSAHGCKPGDTRSVACGNCGMETDTCNGNCQWVAGSCGGEGACKPGDTRSVACGNCGAEIDTCSTSCQWTMGTCGTTGACTPGQVRTVACGNCGMEVDTCGSNCVWTAGACTGEGACAPGTTKTVACGNCGTEVDTCSGSCQWTAGTCVGQGACSPGSTRKVSCGNCGSEMDTCSASCQWSAGTCTAQGACAPGATRTVSCGNCGSEIDTCSLSCAWSPGSCSGQGACKPGSTRTVGCGNCGTETDTCSTSCSWTAGACANQGACAPGTTSGSGCDPCSQKTCAANCQWGACGLKPGNACEYRSGTDTRGCSCSWFGCGSSQLQWCLSSCQWSTECACCTSTTCTRCK